VHLQLASVEIELLEGSEVLEHRDELREPGELSARVGRVAVGERELRQASALPSVCLERR
jgi:hypothetical protein